MNEEQRKLLGEQLIDKCLLSYRKKRVINIQEDEIGRMISNDKNARFKAMIRTGYFR